MERGIKEIKELLRGLGASAAVTRRVMQDGRVDFADAAVLYESREELEAVVAGFRGIENIPAEVSDLSGDEAKEALGVLLEEVQATF